MKKAASLIGVFLGVAAVLPGRALAAAEAPVSVAPKTERAPAAWVNPLIDTHQSRWFYFSSACRPFGMVNLSPDTDTGDDWKKGYLYGSSKIRCFSHIHGWQLYGVAVMPVGGVPGEQPAMDDYASEFSHEDEVVQPGYHKVALKKNGIVAELTATTRVGFHRYAFPAGKPGTVLFDTGATLMAPMLSSGARKVSATEIAGYAMMAPTPRRPRPFTVYYVARFSRPLETFGGWKNRRPMNASADSVAGTNVTAFATFAPAADGAPLLMKMAISYVSVEGARRNLDAELPHWDFERVRREAFEDWNRWLGKIEVRGGTDAQKTKFYTDLWHALLGRRIVSDVDGRYCDMTSGRPVTRRVRMDAADKPLFPHHNFDALWGSHWSLNLLWSFAYPDVMDAFCNTMVDMYKNGGLIPRGPSGGNYTYVMIGDPAVSFFAAAYNKGIRGYDAEKAYEGLKKNAFPGGIRDHAGYEHATNACGGGMKYYVSRGYVPEDIEGKGGHKDGAAMTLEYAYQDWCLAQMAEAMSKYEDARMFTARSLNYTNLWDAKINWMHPRKKDGQWLPNFSPVATGGAFTVKGFCEASAAVYTHYVPHDMPGLIRLFGGPTNYVAALNHQFELAEPARFLVPHGQHGFSWVDYDNQPATAMAHLFNLAGAPWLSQKWVRAVKEKAFGDVTPFGGYNGDEDQGQMGALGVLMALGLFDVEGGAAVHPAYQLTSPVFDEVVLHLDRRYFPGGQVVIRTRNNRPGNIYIQSAQWNGKPLNRCSINHADLVAGGELVLELGPEPNRSWGVER